ncbi:MAG: 50S ribosomal protein L20 [bacterium]
MPRVKRGTTHVKRRKKLLAKAKGYMWGRKNLIKLATTAVVKAGAHAYADRRKKKRVNRSLWQIKISALTKANGLSYSKFMGAVKAKNIVIDRKIMADLAENNPQILIKILEEVKS